MGIIRAPRVQSNFYILDKRISEDKRLTWAARGLLIFLLGKPDHWRVSVQNLRSETKDSAKHTSRDGVYNLLKELETAGYVQRTQAKLAGGQFGEVDYIVGESGLTPLPENPEPVPLPDSPLPAPPLPANPPLVSTDVLASTEKAARKERARATRLPADWHPGEEEIAFCRTERPDLRLADVVSKFRDHWTAQPGQRGVKADWPATWRNWVRREIAAPAKRQSWSDKNDEVVAKLTGRYRDERDDGNFIDV